MFPRRLGASLGFQGFHCPPGAHHWLDHLAAAGTDVGLPGFPLHDVWTFHDV